MRERTTLCLLSRTSLYLTLPTGILSNAMMQLYPRNAMLS